MHMPARVKRFSHGFQCQRRDPMPAQGNALGMRTENNTKP